MLNEALRLIRVYHDMPQTDAAGKLGISKSYLSEIEAGKKVPTLHILENYSKAFSIPLSSILFFSEHMQDGVRGERVRVAVSKKVLKLLDFIALRAKPTDGQGR